MTHLTFYVKGSNNTCDMDWKKFRGEVKDAVMYLEDTGVDAKYVLTGPINANIIVSYDEKIRKFDIKKTEDDLNRMFYHARFDVTNR